MRRVPLQTPVKRKGGQAFRPSRLRVPHDFLAPSAERLSSSFVCACCSRGSLRWAGLLRLRYGADHLQHPRPQCRIPAKKSVHRRPGAPRTPSQQGVVQNVTILPMPFGEVHGDNCFARHALDCSRAYAQETVGIGLVTGVEIATSTLTLDTRSGGQRVFVAPTGPIRDAHDRTLALGDIDPGGAVAYQGVRDSATSRTIRRKR